MTVGGIAADRAGGRAHPSLRRRPAATCPPEDTGGPWGFADMLEAAADPGTEPHGVAEWLGEVDPAAFSVEAAEARLRAWFAPKRTRKPRGKR